MADLIAFQTYHHSNLLPPSSSTMIPRHAHKRSLSSEYRGLSPEKTVTKAKSTTDLSETISKNGSNSQLARYEEDSFNTLQDPRLAIKTEVSPSTSSTHHPDLSNEVAALSVKLIQAINNQTLLDDSLGATRQELELAHSKIQALEFQNEKYRRDIDEKVYIKKSDSDREIMQLGAALAEERTQREIVEKGKKTIEQELEALTADLFQEANKMVAAAKIEREAVEKKNEQLRSQIKDTELLLASHQDQLAELKSVMQGMHLSKDDVDSRTASTAPSSPAGPFQMQGATQEHEPNHAVATPCNPEELIPGPSCNFPEILRMVCRTDLQAYDDFRELLTLSRSSKPPSRAGSGSYAGLNVMSLAGFGSGSASANNSPTKGVTSSPSSLASQLGSHIPLKDTRFYKRVLMEDIEPTLRLDLAPGISWLTRRTVISGICEGTLVVEPMPTMTKKYEFPCTVCGERRPGPQNERTHRFRTSESETAQRYSLCIQCLERIRSCCEFTGYLRLILDGHLKAGDNDEEKEIWEETIRLRERMFWSRVAGGIVPLVRRAAGPEAEGETKNMNVNVSEETRESGLLHPTDNVIVESKPYDMSGSFESTQSQRNSSIFAPSLPDFDMAKPGTPDPHSYQNAEIEDSTSDVPQRRGSVDSDVSVYEEANAQTEYTESEEAQTPTVHEQKSAEVTGQSSQ
ncbi:hypothetical protein N7451_006910 [Penicillium sp. IBT 35674x]|nr:hypothetical protein CBS147337_8057 [Penicillium roqueforti]KAJ5999100.1 hypothetical protein N7451_006910 [Penicillium sp. IBT 35674x]